MPKIYRYLLPIYDVSIIAWPSAEAIPFTANFMAIIRGGSPPYTYHWDFGDGSPPSNLPSPTHTYEKAGIFTVTLTVKDSLNLAAQTTTKITAFWPPGLITLAVSISQALKYIFDYAVGPGVDKTMAIPLTYAKEAAVGPGVDLTKSISTALTYSLTWTVA